MTKPKIDTRSFPQLWYSLNPIQRRELTSRIISSCMVTEVAIRNWAGGRRTPCLLYQKNVVTALESLGIRTTPQTLFPFNKKPRTKTDIIPTV